MKSTKSLITLLTLDFEFKIKSEKKLRAFIRRIKNHEYHESI